MRNIVVIGCLLFISISFSQPHQINYLEEWINKNSDFSLSSTDDYFSKNEIFNVYGQVKNITQTEYKVLLKDDKIIKGENTYSIDNYSLKYSKSSIEKQYLNPNTVESFHINNAGLITSITTIYYDANNKFDKVSYEYKNNLLKKSVDSNSDLGVYSYGLCKHKDNKIVELKEYIDGEALHFGKKLFEYNETENTIFIKEENNLYGHLYICSLTLKFKDNKLVFVEEKYEGDERVKKHIYEYDKKGNLTSIKEYLGDELNEEVYYEYEFDEYENWIQKIIHVNQKPKYIFTREIEYY